MRKIALLIAGLGNWLMSLSNRSRMFLVFSLLLLLAGGSIYKLVYSIEEMQKPLKPSNPQEFIEPMQKIVELTKGNVEAYQQRKQTDMRQLDSLAKLHFATKVPSK